MDNPRKKGHYPPPPPPKCPSRFIDLAEVLNKLAPQQMMYTASILCASMKIRPNSTIDLHFISGLWDSHMNIINNIVRGALCVHLLHQV